MNKAQSQKHDVKPKGGGAEGGRWDGWGEGSGGGKMETIVLEQQ